MSVRSCCVATPLVAEGELVGELGPRGEKAAERIFQTDADRKRPERFVAAMAVVGRIVDLGRADADSANRDGNSESPHG